MRFELGGEYEPASHAQDSIHSELVRLGVPPNLLPSSTSPSSSLVALLSVNQRYRDTHQSPSHIYNAFGDAERQDTIEEVSWHRNKAIWWKDGKQHLTYTFDEDQDVVCACWARFDIYDAAPTWTDRENPSASAHTLDQRPAESNEPNLFSPFRRPSPQAWTHDSLTQPVHPTQSIKQGTPAVERYLLVFLHDIAFAYPPGGGRISFRLPFRVAAVTPLDRGVLIERAREGSEILDVSADGQHPLKPTLYSLLNVQDQIVPVATATTIENLLNDDPETRKRPLGRIAPLQDLDIRIVAATETEKNAERLVVMVNSRQDTVSIWAYAHLPKAELDTLENSFVPLPNGFPHATTTAGGRPDRKGKGRASEDMNASSSSMLRSASGSGRRKRSSIMSHAAERSFSNRRTSNVGATAQPFSQHLQDEADLISMIGGTGEKSVLMNDGGRRTSMGARPEASMMAIDRMALGLGAAPDMERDPSGDDASLAQTAEIGITKIWESDWIAKSQGKTDTSTVKAYIFDSRSVPERASLVAIHVPSKQSLLILRISRTASGSFSVQTVQSLDGSAAQCCQLAFSRPDVLDLLVFDSVGACRLVTMDGKMSAIALKSWPQNVPLKRAGSDSSKHLVVEADVEDHSSTIIRCCRAMDDLTLRCFKALAHVLPFECIGVLVSSSWELDRSFEHLQSLVCASLQQEEIKKPAHRRKAILALHLVAEECKLVKKLAKDYDSVSRFILKLFHMETLHPVADDGPVKKWVWLDHYHRALGMPCQNGQATTAGLLHDVEPFDVLAHLAACTIATTETAAHDIRQIIRDSLGPPSGFCDLEQPYTALVQISDAYACMRSKANDTHSSRAIRVVEHLHSLGWKQEDIAGLSFGVSLPIREAIRLCQGEPPSNWNSQQYELVHRPDLARQVAAPAKKTALQKMLEQTSPSITSPTTSMIPQIRPSNVASRFSEDRRLEEVWRMLQYSDPVTIGGGDRSLDQLTPQVQQSILNALSNRTYALPIGFAMFTYSSGDSKAKDAMSVLRVNTSARILPLPSPVSIIDKEPRDGAAAPPDRSEWPEFHSGVAAALRLRFDEIATVDSSEIQFNRPAELDAGHAGLLLGLGLQGQLASITYDQVFEYLAVKHQPTSVGLMLGLGATYLGTADPTVMSVLAVHISALHPRGSQELLLSGMTTSAAVVSVGLLHIGSRKRSLADILIRELRGIRVVDIEESGACREAYALSAGFAIGMIMLGAGRKAIPDEVELLRTMHSLVVGSGNRPLPGVNSASDVTDVNITSPAATVALALMYLKSNRADVANLLELPDTLRMLDYVRSDLLLLRTTARALINWDAVKPTKEWIESNVPRFILEYPVKGISIFENDIDVAKWNIIAGACLGIGLKYAGTAVAEAHGTIIHYLDRLTKAAYSRTNSILGKIKRTAIRACLSVVALSLSLVMAGTGEINVLRRLRVAHGHFSEGVTFGTHLASHMALGLLFVGSGHWTLGTSDTAIAALFLSCFPVFPTTSLDNRSHLQAFRHLWTLAAEPRCLTAKDVDTGESVFLPVRLRLVDKGSSGRDTIVKAKQLVAPTLLPELDLIESIQVDSPRYWSFAIDLKKDAASRARFVRDPTIYVKRRTGHLSYAQDTRGLKSIFTRSKSETGSSVYDFGEITKTLSASVQGLLEFVSGFTQNEEALEYVKNRCLDLNASRTRGPNEEEAFSAAVLLECLTRDKHDIVTVYHDIRQAFMRVAASNGSSDVTTAARDVEQLGFAVDFYRRGAQKTLFPRSKSASSFSSSSSSSNSNGAGKTNGGAAASSSAAHLPSSFREPLVQTAFVDHVYQKTLAKSADLLSSATVRQRLHEYLRGPAVPTSAEGMAVDDGGVTESAAGRADQTRTEEDGKAVALWLVMNDAPSLRSIDQLRSLVNEEIGRQQSQSRDRPPPQTQGRRTTTTESEGEAWQTVLADMLKLRLGETAKKVEAQGGRRWTRAFTDELVAALTADLQ